MPFLADSQLDVWRQLVRPPVGKLTLKQLLSFRQISPEKKNPKQSKRIFKNILLVNTMVRIFAFLKSNFLRLKFAIHIKYTPSQLKFVELK